MHNLFAARYPIRFLDKPDCSAGLWAAHQGLTRYFLLFVLSLTALVWMILPKQLVFSDPAEYLLLASDLTNLLSWDMDYPFEHRLSLLFVHWLSMEWFGTNAFGVFLPQFLLFASVLLVLNRCCHTLQGKIFAFAVAFALFPYTLEVFPDLGASVFMFYVVLLLAKPQGARSGVLASLLMLVAFCFKMTAYYLAVPVLLVLVIDAARRKFGRFHVALVLTSIAIALAYLLFYQLGYGDALARLRTASDLSDTFLWSTHETIALLRRLFVIPPGEFLSGYGVALVFAMVASVYLFKTGRSNRLMIVYVFASMLLFTFGSSSFSSYQPLPFFDRMLLFAIPPFAYLSGRFVDLLVTRGLHDRAARALMVCTLVFIAHHSFLEVAKKVVLSELSEKESVRQAVIKDGDHPVIVAEDRTRRMMQIYSGFDASILDRFHVCPDLTSLENPESYAFMIDRERAGFLAESYGTAVCAQELEAFIEQQGITVRVDNATMLYAYN